MKRLVQVAVQAVIEVDSKDEVEEAVDDIVKFANWNFDSYTLRFADWDVDSYTLKDCGVVEE